MRNLIGYLLGLCLFVLGIPSLMWLVSGRGWPYVPGTLVQVIAALVLALAGLSLSIWSIVYMRRVGKGNPMDAFGHEVAPRTRHLMTDGPYRINRNPMLSGTLLYLAGVAVWLWRWPAWLVLAVFFAVMLVQVLSEEKRLRRDFGEEYETYCRRTRRF